MMKKRKKNSCICDSAIRKLKENKLSTWFSRPKKTMLVITSTAIFFFFQLITYHWHFVSYRNIRIFIKWKHVKYHPESSKYPFHPGVEFSVFSPRWKIRISQKSLTPGWISPGLRVTCLLDLNLKIAWITLLKLDWF